MRTAVRQTIAAVAFAFATWRADAALRRSGTWERRARRLMEWGDMPISEAARRLP